MMTSIDEIEQGELRDALVWALNFLHAKFEPDAAKVGLKQQSAVAFAAAHILTREIDMPAGDRRLYDRLDAEFRHVFNVWFRDK